MVRFSPESLPFLVLAYMAAVKADEVPVRKEIRSLTQEELSNYFSAIRKWHIGKVPANVSSFPNYATFLAYHAASAMYHDSQGPVDRMHFGGHFLPLHGWMMHEFEKGIRYYDPTVAAHYWDWTVDPKGIFTDAYVGEFDQYGNITNGQLKNFPVTTVGQVSQNHINYLDWRTNPPPPETDLLSMDSESPIRHGATVLNPSRYIGRNVNDYFLPSRGMPTTDQVTTCLNKKSYKDHWCCIFWDEQDRESCRNGTIGTAESNLHGAIHGWYSGGVLSTSGAFVAFDSMDAATSPNDPVWLLHHSQVERMHQAWQKKTGASLASEDDPCGGYNVPNDKQVRLHGLNDNFFPPSPDIVSTPARACAFLYRGDPLYVYDSYPMSSSSSDSAEPSSVTAQPSSDTAQPSPSVTSQPSLNTAPPSSDALYPAGHNSPIFISLTLSIVVCGWAVH